jgi:hypothetical protein
MCVQHELIDFRLGTVTRRNETCISLTAIKYNNLPALYVILYPEI